MTIQNPSIQLNSYTSRIELKDLFESYKDLTSIGINCHHIGTVQSFDSATQTANATINYKKTKFVYDQSSNSYLPQQIDYPLLMQCPVICLGGGTASLTFPIAQGDECLILFNDRSIDNWLQNGSGQALNDPRLHSISDGIILVGIRSAQKILQNYDTTHVVLKNGDAQVAVSSSLIKIANGSQNLKTVLGNLISAIESATYGGNSIDSTAALEAVRTEIAGLLE